MATGSVRAAPAPMSMVPPISPASFDVYLIASNPTMVGASNRSLKLYVAMMGLPCSIALPTASSNASKAGNLRMFSVFPLLALSVKYHNNMAKAKRKINPVNLPSIIIETNVSPKLFE